MFRFFAALLVGCTCVGFEAATADAADPLPCDATWIEESAPALRWDVTPRVVYDRAAEPSLERSRDANAANYRRDYPTAVSITAGARDPQPFSKTYASDVRDRIFPLVPTRRRGSRYTLTASWVEDVTDPRPGSSPCRRTITKDVKAFLGYWPILKTRGSGGLFTFKLRQRRGRYCEWTPPGKVWITVRGPDATRKLMLSGLCGKWSKRQTAAGWRLYGWQDYYDYGRSIDQPEAWVDFRYQTPGTRRFHYRVTFRNRLLERGRFDARTVVCQGGVCQG